MRVVVVDFEDSFTYNIACELKLIGLNPVVIHHKDFFSFKKSWPTKDEKMAVVLGPGPGHPDEYLYCLEKIKRLKEMENVYLMGVCLGHQLIWKSLGADIKQIEKPLHGQTKEIYLSGKIGKFLSPSNPQVKVQVYNSLKVELSSEILKAYEFILSDDGPMIGMAERMITYQFHPESIGTSYRRLFFGPIKGFLV